MVNDVTGRSLGEWLDFLVAQHPTEIELGLQRIGTVARRMGLLTPAAKVITLAGTNGKGTTAALLELSLLNAGYRIGCFTSPHLHRYRERVRIDGQELADSAHCQAFAAVEQARGDTPLTFFEASALGALWLFAREPLDVLLLEIGLGGRLDAVNIIDADIAVITSIDVDHQEWLGDNREQIGIEKAGIMRAGAPVVCGDPEPPRSIAREADRHGALLCQRERDFFLHRITTQDQTPLQSESGWQWLSADQAVKATGQWPLPAIPLDNAATAWQVLRLASDLGLPVSEQQFVAALATLKVAGRMQQLKETPLVIADVAHNPHAAAYLATQLQQRFAGGERAGVKLHAVAGMLQDKDVTQVMGLLEPLFARWYLTPLATPRSATAEQLADCLSQSTDKQIFPDTGCALRQAIDDAGEKGVVVVFGSFYTVADAIQELEG